LPDDDRAPNSANFANTDLSRSFAQFGARGRQVRIFHTSDTHLGHAQYPRTDATGLNQREADIYATWHHLIDLAVAEKPDLFIHAGDLFDGVRPSNRALAHALDGFLKLSRAGIPAVAIAGNHEHPRMRETGSAFRLFEHLDGVHVAYRGQRETIRIDTKSGPVRVHAVPQCADNETLAKEALASPTADNALDILVLHGSVPSLPAFAHAEFNELTLDTSWFTPHDYVALGHHHGAQQVAPNAWYCGAPDRVSIAESGQEKGFLDVTLAPSQDPQVRFRPLPTRVYADLPAIDARGLGAEAVRMAAVTALARVPAGAIARLKLEHLGADLRGGLDLRAIQQAAAHVVHLDLRLDWADVERPVRGGAEVGPLGDEFTEFLGTQPIEGLDRARLVAKARELLEAAP
jgi:exonuclease SbcD